MAPCLIHLEIINCEGYKFDQALYKIISITMLVSKFKVLLKTLGDSGVSHSVTTKESWYSSLKNIYGIQGPNFDGYISNVYSENNSLNIECYTVEGPEEAERLLAIKGSPAEWLEYKKIAVATAILIHAATLGYEVHDHTLIPL